MLFAFPKKSAAPKRTALRALGLALTLCGSAATTSCLIGPPQELEEAEQISPIPYLDQVTPPLNAPVEFTSSASDTFLFTVPFASEDLGEKPLGRLYLNWGTDDVSFLADSETNPGQISDQNRSMTLPFTRPPNTPGCYSVTMVITYQSNRAEFGTFHDPKKAAIVSWIVAVNKPFHELTLADCPPAFDPQ